VLAKVREGRPGGRIETMGGRICETGRLFKPGVKERGSYGVVKQKRKK